MSGNSQVPEGMSGHGSRDASPGEGGTGRFRYSGGRNLPDTPPPPDPDVVPVDSATELAPGPGGGPLLNARSTLDSPARCDDIAPGMPPAKQFSGQNLIRLNTARGVVDPSLAASGKIAPPYLMGNLQTELSKATANTELAGTYLGLVARQPVSSDQVKSIGFQLCAELTDAQASEIASIAEQQRLVLLKTKATEVAQVTPDYVAIPASAEPEKVQTNIPFAALMTSRVPAPERLRTTGHFDFDRSALRAATRALLDAKIIWRGGVRFGPNSVIVNGHTDHIGPPAYNQKLSVKRAQAVKNYLVANGIPASAIVIKGFGATQPATGPGVRDCSPTPAGRERIQCLQPHRRAEVELTDVYEVVSLR